MILLDTNFLILALQAGTSEERELANLVAARELLNISTIVWTEFLCGPTQPGHMSLARQFFPAPVPYMPQDSIIAAELYNGTGRRRGSILDCMIAATVVRLQATLATKDVNHFQRFAPWGLKLLTP